MYNSASTGRGEKSALFDGPEHVKRLKSSEGRGEKSALFHGEEHMKDSHRVRGAATKLKLFHGLHERAKRKARGGHPFYKMSRSTAARKLPLSTF